ncbi:hypothetical protein BV20DRAFT_1039904 [Pilatotrama ljubarskyi]|nr:hypothetical protein BV20DRAFT_1039904 [Pilatotrama ljubarskyi]
MKLSDLQDALRGIDTAKDLHMLTRDSITAWWPNVQEDDVQILVRTACEIQAEDERREGFTDILHEGDITPARAARNVVGLTEHEDDGDLRAVCLGVEVVKGEIGTDAGDPFVEVIHGWIENIRTFFESLPDKSKAERLNFPAVLVVHFGLYLGIAAAVYGEDPIVELLCCIPMHVHDTKEAQLKRESGHPVFENGTPLCVKFSKRYSVAAHGFAHETGFALALRAVDKVYDWIMVVMEDVTARYSNTMWNIKRLKGLGKGKSTPGVTVDAGRAEVRKMHARLHEGGFVHGDVREVKVLVRDDDAPGTWAGEAGKVVYRRGINTQVGRPAAVRAAEVIKAEHDLWMAGRLVLEC